MRLFSRLLQFQTEITQTEDFFTEIVAHLLRQTDDLLLEWLHHLGLPEVDIYTDFELSTQISFKDRIPDILIELFADGGKEWIIIIESKLGAQEGRDQLRSYASILARKTHAHRRTLLFITRDFDPKQSDKILKNLTPGSVTFQQTRWHHFYQFLKARRDNPLINEVCAFMEEHHMAQRNQFTPTDLLALSKIPQILNLMNETMFGEVSNQFEQLIGTVSTVNRTRQQLKHNRYLLLGNPHPSYWVGIGYWFNELAYPNCGMILQFKPQSTHEKEILDVFRALNELSEWGSYNLNKPRKWPEVTRSLPLTHFLVGDDHVQMVKEHFLHLLNVWEKLHDQYPQLPRSVTSAAPIEDDEEE